MVSAKQGGIKYHFLSLWETEVQSQVESDQTLLIRSMARKTQNGFKYCYLMLIILSNIYYDIFETIPLYTNSKYLINIK